MDTAAPSLCSGKIKKPQEDAKPFNLLQTKGIISMQQLREKASAMNKDYYDTIRMNAWECGCSMEVQAKLELILLKIIFANLPYDGKRKKPSYKQAYYHAQNSGFEKSEPLFFILLAATGGCRHAITMEKMA